MEALDHQEDPDTSAGLIRHPPLHQTAYLQGHPADECPGCESGQICWVTNRNSESNYLCEACGRCWTADSVGVVRVDPLACPGCAHRDACFDKLRTEVPPWWWLPID
jgi:ribosomal protein S27E